MKEKQLSNQTKNWSWIKTKRGKYLQSNLLKKFNFNHGFFTREWNNLGPEELVKELDKNFGFHVLKQMHGALVVNASSTSNKPHSEADGLISDHKNQSLWVYTADCIPILFADPIKGFTAACHAGWKGISKGIILETIKKLELIGAKKSQLIVVLGPSIDSKNYQVKSNILEPIYTSIYPSIEGALISLHEKKDRLTNLGIISHQDLSNQLFLDIKQAALTQILKAGINPSRISICPFCTYMNKNLFNSWRRDHTKAIQWSGIASKL